MKHYHFEINAYQKFRKKDFQMIDVTVVSIVATTEEEALEKAKDLVIRNHYRLGKVWECHEAEVDFHLREDMQILQLKLMAKHLK